MPEFIGEKGMILELSLLAIQVRSSQSLPLSDSPLNDKLAASHICDFAFDIAIVFLISGGPGYTGQFWRSEVMSIPIARPETIESLRDHSIQKSSVLYLLDDNPPRA